MQCLLQANLENDIPSLLLCSIRFTETNLGITWEGSIQGCEYQGVGPSVATLEAACYKCLQFSKGEKTLKIEKWEKKDIKSVHRTAYKLHILNYILNIKRCSASLKIRIM